ncbi:MAG: RNA 2',3'-cyclic phosphodiesterase [Phycisphaerae bacterium]|nr:RNA 2',3'-cyclic phosphodiesterase [Phycisphaerae bacterium]
MRLFIAIDVDAAIRQAMLKVAKSIHAYQSQISWTTAEQLHLTLKFIGEVDDLLAATMADRLQQLARRFPPITILTEGVGCFPPSGPVRIIWIGGREPTGTLVKVVHGIEDFAEELGVPREKRTFSEHFTIGRVKSDGSRGKLRTAVQTARFGPMALQISQLVLYQSILQPKGAQYVPLCRAALSENSTTPKL